MGENALQILAAAVTGDHGSGQGYPGLIHLRNEHIDRRRWVVVHLDVYMHPATGTLAGVLYELPATEMQEGSESPPEVVPVEPDPTPHYRIKRTPR